MDAQQGKVRLDHLHHLGHRSFAEQRQPFCLWQANILVAKTLGQPLTDRDQIIAGVQPFGDFNGLAQCLAIAQMRGPRQNIDLPTGIVNIIFAHDTVACEFHQCGKRVAHHSATAMPHMHWPRRVGGDIFDIYRFAVTTVRPPIIIASLRNRAQFIKPCRCVEPQIQKARSGDFDSRDAGNLCQFRGQGFGQLARIKASGFCKHHRRVGRYVAMRWIAWRFDGHMRAINARWQGLRGNKCVQRMIDMRCILFKKGHLRALKKARINALHYTAADLRSAGNR